VNRERVDSGISDSFPMTWTSCVYAFYENQMNCKNLRVEEEQK